MKNLLFLLLFTPLLLNAQSEKGIQFEEGLRWDQIKAKAKEEKKYIFVDAYATWCGPCKMMDSNVYIDPGVGSFVNNKFISVKVQMDKTPLDNEQVKSWYTDAEDIKKTYKVTAFPSFLFFSPDGKLIHKDYGYRNIGAFIQLSNLALDPLKPMYYAQLEAYKKGKKDYAVMGKLALFVKRMIGDKVLSNTIARDYKKHIDKQPSTIISKRENLDFIGEFNDLINSQDPFFHLCYLKPEQVDQIMQYKGWANFQVTKTIMREDIENKLFKNGQLITKDPDWNKISTTISKKYEQLDVKKLVLNYQIYYYDRLVKDWQQWALCVDEKIKTYSSEPGFESFGELNMPAWNTFLHCNDKNVLTKALEWSDLSIKLKQPDNVIQELDTRANLLYKLGRTDEAIEQEEKAIKLSTAIAKKEGTAKGPFQDEFIETIDKMKKGEPTWPAK